MFGNWVLSFLALIVSFPALAQFELRTSSNRGVLHQTPQSFSFRLEGASIWEAKQVEVCLSYSDCGAIANVLPMIDLETRLPNGQYQVAVAGLNEFGVTSKLAGCGLGKFINGKARRQDGSILTVVQVTTSLPIGPVPAALSLGFADEHAEILQPTLIESMSGDIKAAGKTLMQLFGLPEPYYQFDYKYLEGSEVTTTDHELRRIQIPPRYASSCDFWWAMRHEMEHIAQKQFANQCAQQGKAHLYSIQYFRELSAYLGDMAYASIACDEHDTAIIQVNSVFNFARYLKMGPAAH